MEPHSDPVPLTPSDVDGTGLLVALGPEEVDELRGNPRPPLALVRPPEDEAFGRGH